MAQLVKNPPTNAEDARDLGSIPGSQRSPGGGHENPLQCLFLENLMDRGAWRATVHRVTELDTPEWLSMHASIRANLFKFVLNNNPNVQQKENEETHWSVFYIWAKQDIQKRTFYKISLLSNSGVDKTRETEARQTVTFYEGGIN